MDMGVYDVVDVEGIATEFREVDACKGWARFAAQLFYDTKATSISWHRSLCQNAMLISRNQL